MNIGLLLPLLLVMVAIAGAIFAIGSRIDEKQVVRESLRSIDGYDLDAVPDMRAEQMSESIGARALLPAMAKLTAAGRKLTPMGYVDKVRAMFVHAGIQTPDSVDRFLAAKAVVFPLGIAFTIMCLFTDFLPVDGFFGIILAGVLGFGIAQYPDIWLGRKVAERQKAILRTLPDVLDLLTI